MKEEIIVCGLDPRVSNCIIFYNFNEKKFHVLHFATLNKTSFPTKELRMAAKEYTPSLVFLDISERYLDDLIVKYKPDIVVTEDAFYQDGFATAFRVLAAWVSGISLMLYRKHNKSLHTIPPRTIKKIIIGDAKAKKDETKILMKNAILSNKDIVWYDEDYETKLTEHSIDAIACAIAKIKMIEME